MMRWLAAVALVCARSLHAEKGVKKTVLGTRVPSSQFRGRIGLVAVVAAAAIPRCNNITQVSHEPQWMQRIE